MKIRKKSSMCLFFALSVVILMKNKTVSLRILSEKTHNDSSKVKI